MSATVEHRLKDVQGEIVRAGHEAQGLKADADELVADYRRRGLNPLTNEGASRKVEAAYAAVDSAASKLAALKAEAQDLVGRFARQVPGAVDSGDGVTLAANESFAEWLHTHGGIPSQYAGEKLSFGKYIRQMVLGGGGGLEASALSEGTLADGGYLVPTPLSAQVIDLARNQARVFQAGATTVPMSSETLSIARLASDPQAGWKVENAAIDETAITFERVVLHAHTLIGVVRASRELIEDAINLESVLSDAFAKSLALELDRVCLYGSGSGEEPKGILTTTGVQIAYVDAALAIPGTYLDAIGLLWGENEEATGIIQSNVSELAIARAEDTLNQPKRLPDVLNEIPRFRTKQVHSAAGTNNNQADIFTADWRQLLVGMRSELRIEVLRERYADNHQIGFVAHLRADVQLARPKAFVVSTAVE